MGTREQSSFQPVWCPDNPLVNQSKHCEQSQADKPPESHGFSNYQEQIHLQQMTQENLKCPTCHNHYGSLDVTQDTSQCESLIPDTMNGFICVAMCCFWPTGLVALQYARKALAALYEGDTISARKNARLAKRMVIVSVTIGIVLILLGTIIFAASIAMDVYSKKIIDDRK